MDLSKAKDYSEDMNENSHYKGFPENESEPSREIRRRTHQVRKRETG